MSERDAMTRLDAAPAAGARSNLIGTLPAGTRLGEFELIRVIGDGGFGIVYLAWDHSLERRVALKEYMPATIASRGDGTTVSPRSEEYRETFEAGMRSFVNEARMLASFDHPALIKVYRFWEANGTACMVMPFYEAGTLQAAVRAMPAPPDETWLRRLLTPLCDALSMLHAAHCYHRDISPDNILLLPPADRPVLLDFGAARRVIGGMTHSLTTILKPGYAPIEQYAEVPGLRQGPATDVYALGATVHWMITGRTPPPAVARMLDDAYEPLSVVAAGRYSPRFLRAIDHALAVRPESRTPSIEAFCEDLSAGPRPRVPQPREPGPDTTVALPLTVPAPPPAEPAPVPEGRPLPAAASALLRRRPVWLGAAALLVIGAIGSSFAWRQRAPQVPASPVASPAQASVPPVQETEIVLSATPGWRPDALPTEPTAAGHTVPPPVPSAATPPAVRAEDAAKAATGPQPQVAALAPAPATGDEPAQRPRPKVARRTAEQAANEVRRVECAQLMQRGGLFGAPSAAQKERARRLGCT